MKPSFRQGYLLLIFCLLAVCFMYVRFAVLPNQQTAQQQQEHLAQGAREHRPAHLDVAHLFAVQGAGARGLGQGAAEGPAAEDVPLVDAGEPLEADELVAGLGADPDGLGGRCHHSGYGRRSRRQP